MRFWASPPRPATKIETQQRTQKHVTMHFGPLAHDRRQKTKNRNVKFRRYDLLFCLPPKTGDKKQANRNLGPRLKIITFESF